MNRPLKLFTTIICTVCMMTAFTACNDDDEKEKEDWREGAKVNLPDYRAFVLCEGQMSKNDAHLFSFDPAKGELMAGDIYEAQNGKKLGDTANDILVYDDDIYIVVNMSEVLLRLNGSGVEKARYANFEADGLGQPRNIVAEDGKLYVTCYGGFVARFDAKTLALEAKVAVDANPEQIVEMGDSLYCVNSGYGKGHTLSVISIKDFKESKSVETLANPYGICKANGRLYISAYGADYSNPVGVYDIKTNKTRTIGNAGRVLASGDRLYMTTSTSPDWVNYVTTFSVYNAITGSVEEWKLKNAPEEMTSGTAIPYFMQIDPVDGCMYIGYTDYHSNGRIYRFNANDSYKGMFTVDALNPNGMVFLINR